MVHKKKSPAMIYTHAIQPFVIVDRRTGKETPQGLRLTPIPDWRNQR
jgi:hypothetical protein